MLFGRRDEGHGPIALLEEGTPSSSSRPTSNVYDKIISTSGDPGAAEPM